MKTLFSFILLFFAGCASTSPQEGFFIEDVDLTKEKSDLYFSIGQSYQRNKRTEDAIENYQESLAVDPRNHEAHFALGKLLLKKSFIKKGVEHIEKALAVNENYTEARNFLAYLYFEKFKKFKKSYKLINKSSEDLTYRNQEETWALKLRLDYKFLGKKALISTVPKVLAVEPKSCRYRSDIARTLYKMSVYGRALDSARMAGKICVKDKDQNYLTFLKGLIYIRKNDYLVAQKLLSGISPKTDNFKKLLNRTQIAVRKKINSGM